MNFSAEQVTYFWENYEKNIEYKNSLFHNFFKNFAQVHSNAGICRKKQKIMTFNSKIIYSSIRSKMEYFLFNISSLQSKLIKLCNKKIEFEFKLKKFAIFLKTKDKINSNQNTS